MLSNKIFLNDLIFSHVAEALQAFALRKGVRAKKSWESEGVSLKPPQSAREPLADLEPLPSQHAGVTLI